MRPADDIALSIAKTCEVLGGIDRTTLHDLYRAGVIARTGKGSTRYWRSEVMRHLSDRDALSPDRDMSELAIAERRAYRARRGLADLIERPMSMHDTRNDARPNPAVDIRDLPDTTDEQRVLTAYLDAADEALQELRDQQRRAADAAVSTAQRRKISI